MSQKEISELKTQLQMRMANDEFVRLLKEELKEKSHKCEQLESENKSLKRSLEVKVRISISIVFLQIIFSEPSATVYNKKST
jgi:cell shape-determining protein MreC